MYINVYLCERVSETRLSVNLITRERERERSKKRERRERKSSSVLVVVVITSYSSHLITHLMFVLTFGSLGLRVRTASRSQPVTITWGQRIPLENQTKPHFEHCTNHLLHERIKDTICIHIMIIDSDQITFSLWNKHLIPCILIATLLPLCPYSTPFLLLLLYSMCVSSSSSVSCLLQFIFYLERSIIYSHWRRRGRRRLRLRRRRCGEKKGIYLFICIPSNADDSREGTSEENGFGFLFPRLILFSRDCSSLPCII